MESVFGREGRPTTTSSISGLLLLITCVQPIVGSYPFFWRCPTHFPVEKNFNTTGYVGRWYEIEKFLELDEFSGSCTVSEYTSIGGGKMSVDIFSMHKRTGKGKMTEGRLTPTNATKKEGRFKIDFKPEWSHFKFPSSYWVLDTDYGNYSIIWSCKNSGIINFQGVWFLSRRPRPTDFIRSIVYNKLRSLGIFTRILTHTDQKGCPRLGHSFEKQNKEITTLDMDDIKMTRTSFNDSSTENHSLKGNLSSEPLETKPKWKTRTPESQVNEMDDQLLTTRDTTKTVKQMDLISQ